MFLRKYTLISALSVGVSLASKATESDITLATYDYPGVDRKGALVPLKKWLGNQMDREVVIEIASSPTELAEWVETGKADFVVPNLVGYLKLNNVSKTIMPIAVPDSGASVKDESGYTSSLIASGITSLKDVEDLINRGKTLTVFAVWPDSASGNLFGISKLKEMLTNVQYDSLDIRYVGSHKRVVEDTVNSKIALGIVATSATQFVSSTSSFSEIWRSEPIPFGPLVCVSSKIDCSTIKESLLGDPLAAEGVLDGLKSGWVEFKNANYLKDVHVSEYEKLIEAYNSAVESPRIKSTPRGI